MPRHFPCKETEKPRTQGSCEHTGTQLCTKRKGVKEKKSTQDPGRGLEAEGHQEYGGLNTNQGWDTPWASVKRLEGPQQK